MEITYSEFKPSPELAPYVECYWLQTHDGTPGEESPVQCCLPLGMLEVLIHPDDILSDIFHEGRWQQLPKAFFHGLYNNPVHWKIKANARLFGIRFKPETFAELFSIRGASVFCKFVDLQEILGESIKALPESIYGDTDIESIVQKTNRFLSQKLTCMHGERNYLAEAASLIRNAKGNITIEEVSNTVSVGMRQLQRSFKDSMGTTPKGYLRIIRFRNALASLNDSYELAELAYELGYADQAHFIREFKEFAGQAPRGVIRNAVSYNKKPFELTEN